MPGMDANVSSTAAREALARRRRRGGGGGGSGSGDGGRGGGSGGGEDGIGDGGGGWGGEASFFFPPERDADALDALHPQVLRYIERHRLFA